MVEGEVQSWPTSSQWVLPSLPGPSPALHIPGYYPHAGLHWSCNKTSPQAASPLTSPLHLKERAVLRWFCPPVEEVSEPLSLIPMARFPTTYFSENSPGVPHLHFLFLAVSNKMVRTAFSGGASPEREWIRAWLNNQAMRELQVEENLLSRYSDAACLKYTEQRWHRH